MFEPTRLTEFNVFKMIVAIVNSTESSPKFFICLIYFFEACLALDKFWQVLPCKDLPDYRLSGASLNYLAFGLLDFGHLLF
jgi:hypothetical protein